MGILAFPCNQFGKQEPGKNATEILNCLKYVRPGGGFSPADNLVMMKKCEVNGPKEIPLYKYLKESCPQPMAASFDRNRLFTERIKISDVTWNFEKFIVDKDGLPIFRFLPVVEPFDLEALLRELQSPTSTNYHFYQSGLDKILADIDHAVTARVNSKTGDKG